MSTTLHSFPSPSPYDLATYFSPDSISTVFEDLHWNVASELSILVDIAQNGEPSEQLNAIRQIRSIAQTALTLSGRITKTVVHASAPTPTNPNPTITSGTSISNRLTNRVPATPLPYDPTLRPIDIAANPLTHDSFSTTPTLAPPPSVPEPGT